MTGEGRAADRTELKAGEAAMAHAEMTTRKESCVLGFAQADDAILVNLITRDKSKKCRADGRSYFLSVIFRLAATKDLLGGVCCLVGQYNLLHNIHSLAAILTGILPNNCHFKSRQTSDFLPLILATLQGRDSLTPHLCPAPCERPIHASPHQDLQWTTICQKFEQSKRRSDQKTNSHHWLKS